MTTAETTVPNPLNTETPASTPMRNRRSTRAERYAEECKPFPAVAGETLEERVERLDASLVYLSQCFQDEFEVRDEGTLLVDVITRVLIPFAALSAAISLVYVRVVEWASVHFPSFERVAAYTYLAILAAVLVLLVVARQRGKPHVLNAVLDTAEDRISSSVPVRKETLTRNNFVNRWIYVWVVGAITLFIPLTFIALRSGIADDLGVRVAIDTANVCEGSGRIRLFTGSATCVDILVEDSPMGEQSDIVNATGGEAGRTTIAPTEVADTALDAHVAEIRLDTTTTLALAIAILVIGIVVSMATWWWRNRTVREIELL